MASAALTTAYPTRSTPPNAAERSARIFGALAIAAAPAVDQTRATTDRLIADLKALPASYQLEAVQALAHELSWSYGADLIAEGADRVAADLSSVEG